MTFSNIGKERRKKRLFTDQKTIVVPIDDSLIFGPKNGLFNINDTINTIAKGHPNAILGYKHDIQYLTSAGIDLPFIYNVTASTTMGMHTKKVLVSEVENALISGAECIAAHINFCSKYENEMLHSFAFIANECDKYGIPLLAIAYPRSENGTDDYNYDDVKASDIESYAKLVSHCTRVVCELGADIVKTHYTGDSESFKSVIMASCGCPVIVSGGPKISVRSSLEYIKGAIDAGASGISYGRNVFNSEHIIPYLTVAKDIIFNSCTLDEALKKYNILIGGNNE